MAAAKSKYCAVALKYARDCVDGTVIACKWVRLACERHLKDLERKDWPYVFSQSKAHKICQYIEFLPHIKGKWETPHIRLEPWQIFILCVVFGWVHKSSGLRRFRTVYIEVPRKNAKSTISSGTGLYMLTEDGEDGAEIYSAATTRDQAKIVFNAAQEMARRSPDMREHYGVQVSTHNINVLRTVSKFEALSSEDGTLDGLNVHLGIIDELHAHKTRGVFDVIETATGSRLQSLIWAITTAGSNRSGICYEQRTYVTRILENVFKDESYFGIIYTIDDGDDWATIEAAKKANPNYGISVFPDDIERKLVKALQSPASVNNYLTKHLNVWVSADVGLFDMRAYDACGQTGLKPEDVKDCPCWIGIDLASVNDLTSVVKVFKKIEIVDGKEKEFFYIFGRHYLPEEAITDSRNSQYSGWERMGKLTGTEGTSTDMDVVVEGILEDLATYDVKKLVFDKYNHQLVANPLQKHGVDVELMEEFPQTTTFMSPATDWLIKAILDRRVRHDGCPIMAWAFSNVVGHYDAKDNVYPRKERPEDKIDPAVATIMAIGVAMKAVEDAISYVPGSLRSVG